MVFVRLFYVIPGVDQLTNLDQSMSDLVWVRFFFSIPLVLEMFSPRNNGVRCFFQDYKP